MASSGSFPVESLSVGLRNETFGADKPAQEAQASQLMRGEQVVILLEADAQGLQGAGLLDGESCLCTCCGFVCCRHHGFSPLGRGSALDAPCLMASYYPVCREGGSCTRQTAQTSARSEAQSCLLVRPSRNC